MTSPEAWLRGPIAGVPDMLQPVAHALIQAREEARELLRDCPAGVMWTRRAGLASAGFHLQHISGVIDRLFTYARGESLSDEQRRALAQEGAPPESGGGVADLLDALDAQVERALTQLRATDPRALVDIRLVGRRQLPATMLGLMFHAAEHAQRHVGQMLVTVRMQKEANMYKPHGYTTVAPYLIVGGASGTIDFLKKVFGAIELQRVEGKAGTVRHAEVRLDDTVLMLADGVEGWPPVPSHVHVYVSDVDATYRRALEAGASSVQEPVKKQDADKRGGVKDAGGTTWWIATKID